MNLSMDYYFLSFWILKKITIKNLGFDDDSYFQEFLLFEN